MSKSNDIENHTTQQVEGSAPDKTENQIVVPEERQLAIRRKVSR